MQDGTKDMCTAIAKHIGDYYIVYRIILLRPETMLCYAHVVQYTERRQAKCQTAEHTEQTERHK